MRVVWLMALAAGAACTPSSGSSAPTPQAADFAALCAEPPKKDKIGIEGCVMKDQRATIAVPVDSIRRP